MNIRKTLCAVCALAIAASAALAAEQYFVVTMTDMAGNKTYEVKTKEEVAELKKQVAAETKLFQKAVAKLQKEWEANKDAHQFKWQGQHLKPRAVKESQPYADRDKAMAKADKMTDKELGLDDKKPKTKKKLSEKEEEKLYKERMRQQEFEELAQAVQKEIEAMLAAAAAPAK
jgi:hypothetical protein